MTAIITFWMSVHDSTTNGAALLPCCCTLIPSVAVFYYMKTSQSLAQIDFSQLQMNTLRRYKRHFKLQVKPGMNKAQLAEVRWLEQHSGSCDHWYGFLKNSQERENVNSQKCDVTQNLLLLTPINTSCCYHLSCTNLKEECALLIWVILIDCCGLYSIFLYCVSLTINKV